MEEYWNCFSIDGQFLGTHRRGDPLPSDHYVNMVSIFVINSSNQVLLTQRDWQKSFGGQWENTAGYVQAGEELLTASCRELGEETGIFVSEEELKSLGSYLIDGLSGWLHNYLLLKDVALADIRLQPGETIDVRWQDLDPSIYQDQSIAFPVRKRLEIYENVLKHIK